MKLYKLTRPDSVSYDEYDSFVVAAETPKRAARTKVGDGDPVYYGWVLPENVIVTFLGTAQRGTKSGIIVASYNAG